MKEIYFTSKDNLREFNYKFSDYKIEDPPIRKRRRTMAEKIDKYLIKPNHQQNLIKLTPPVELWVPPEAIYLRHLCINGLISEFFPVETNC